jgi:hypothetical protein
VTYGDFQRLAHEHGWSEDWLAQQLRPHVDDPRRIAQELLAGEGRQRPFTGDYDPQAVCDMRETAIPYACVLELFARTLRQERAQPGEQACECHCGKRVRGKQKYATHACRQRVYQKALVSQNPALEPATSAAQSVRNAKVATRKPQ